MSDSCSGQANVTVDGVSRVVDTYRAASSGWQQVTYAVTGLASASHTFTLTVLGTKQAASCGAWVYVDAFDVTTGSTSAPANQAPTAALTTTVAGLTVTANGSGSRDPDGTIATWTWTWGDGSQSSGSTGSHTYPTAGSYTVTLNVTDNLGATAQTQQLVTVTTPNQAPTAAVTTTVAGLTVTANGSGSRDPDGTIATWTWTWGDGSQSSGSTGSHTYPTAGSYTVTLNVTDNLGATAQTQQLVTVSAPPPSSGTVARWEESDTRIVQGPNAWSWGKGANPAASGGGYLTSGTTGASLRIAFTGTGITWIGVSDSCSGQANVTVDGVARTIDTYSAASSGWQHVTYTVTGLASASHTFTLTVLGTKQAASCGAWVYVDAFDIVTGTSTTTPPPTSTAVSVRFEESNSQIVRGPDQWSWSAGSNAAASGGAYLATGTAGSTLTLTFTGTGVKVIGTLDTCSGNAEITVDGVSQTVNFYRTSGGWQQVAYSLASLPRALHTIRVRVTGTQESASCGPWIYVDAFEVDS